MRAPRIHSFLPKPHITFKVDAVLIDLHVTTSRLVRSFLQRADLWFRFFAEVKFAVLDFHLTSLRFMGGVFQRADPWTDFPIYFLIKYLPNQKQDMIGKSVGKGRNGAIGG